MNSSFSDLRTGCSPALSLATFTPFIRYIRVERHNRRAAGCQRSSSGGWVTLSIPPPQLKQIIHKAQSGNRDAVAHLYESYAQTIYRYIVHRVPTAADAEDLTAEVFVKMVEGLSEYRVADVPFEAWLYRIAAARIADYYRHHARRPLTELSDDLPEHEPLVEEQILYQQELGSLQDAFRQLSDDQQNILIFRFVERKSHEEVGRILNKSVSAVKTIQYRALKALAKRKKKKKDVRHYLRGRHDR